MRKLAIVVTTMFVLSGCSLFGMGDGASSSAGGGDTAAVEAAIKEAEAALDKANKAGGEWRDSRGKFIKEAKAALSKGDTATAMKLAKKAKFQAEMGMQQAQSQEKAGPWLF